MTVITGHYDIGGLEYSSKPQEIEGIAVRIVGSRYSNKQSFFRRIISFFQYFLCAFVQGMRVPDVDIVYASSTPLTVGISAILLKWFRKIPFIFEVRDQWPEIPIELGVIRNPVLKKALLWLERRIYLSSSGIVALSPGMAEGVKRVLGKKKRQVLVAPNCSDLDRFNPEMDGAPIRKEHDWEKKFVLMHFGAMGKANGLEFVVNAADQLKDIQDIHFVIIGDGSQRPIIQKMIEKKGLRNIELLGSINKNDLPRYVAACDVSMVIFADYPILEHNSANKFFDSLAAGKPVLLNYSGWQREAIEQNNAGLGICQCHLEQFINNVTFLYENNEKQIEMSQNARIIAEKHYNRDIHAEEICTFMKDIFKNHSCKSRQK